MLLSIHAFLLILGLKPTRGSKKNLSGAWLLNRFNACAPPRHQRRNIILIVHLPTLNAISIRIIWKGFVAISITKIGGSLYHLSTLEIPTVAAVRGFLCMAGMFLWKSLTTKNRGNPWWVLRFCFGCGAAYLRMPSSF